LVSGIIHFRFSLHPDVDLENLVLQLPIYLTGADLYSLCSNAMLASIERNIALIKQGHVMNQNDRMLTREDFDQAAKRLVPSVSIKDLQSYQELERKIKHS